MALAAEKTKTAYDLIAEGAPIKEQATFRSFAESTAEDWAASEGLRCSVSHSSARGFGNWRSRYPPESAWTSALTEQLPMIYWASRLQIMLMRQATVSACGLLHGDAFRWRPHGRPRRTNRLGEMLGSALGQL